MGRRKDSDRVEAGMHDLDSRMHNLETATPQHAAESEQLTEITKRVGNLEQRGHTFGGASARSTTSTWAPLHIILGGWQPYPPPPREDIEKECGDLMNTMP